MPPPRLLEPLKHADGLTRCPWAGTDPLYVAYHDTDWGVPEWDGRALFEKLVLDGFQAGLSWITILRKREAFRKAFDGFDPAKIARYGEKDFARLMANPGIVRNGAKVQAAPALARIYLDIEARGGFAKHVWSFVDGRPLKPKRKTLADIPAVSPEAEALSKDLKQRGAKFVGPTIVYAFMQAVGMVNDHLGDCCRHGPCAALGERPPW
jgi:DNA-3-methyladenine glycosylase I